MKAKKYSSFWKEFYLFNVRRQGLARARKLVSRSPWSSYGFLNSTQTEQGSVSLPIQNR